MQLAAAQVITDLAGYRQAQWTMEATVHRE